MTQIYFQMVISLIAVILLIVGIAFVFKKKQLSSGSMFNIVGYHSFGPKKGVAALKVGNEIMLIGITPTDLKLLKTIDEKTLETRETEDFKNDDRLSKLKNIKDSLGEF